MVFFRDFFCLYLSLNLIFRQLLYVFSNSNLKLPEVTQSQLSQLSIDLIYEADKINLIFSDLQYPVFRCDSDWHDRTMKDLMSYGALDEKCTMRRQWHIEHCAK